MKNRLWAILVMLLLFSLLSVSALADTAVVNASSLNVRESASSKSDVVKVVKEGTKLEIKDETAAAQIQGRQDQADGLRDHRCPGGPRGAHTQAFYQP